MTTETVSDSGAAFSNTPIILVHGNDESCARFWDETEAGFEQADNGPTHLVIGNLSTDAALQRLSQRYAYSFKELQTFRGFK